MYKGDIKGRKNKEFMMKNGITMMHDSNIYLECKLQNIPPYPFEEV